ncbi:MAG: AAA family ATPase [Pseudomonadota bacterium]
MIPLGVDAPPDIPRFIRELDRFVPLHSLLFLHGNVLDWVAYPVRDAEGRIHWTEGDLPGFLRRYLLGLGYEIVGELDPLEGLTFAAEPMCKRFERILQGQPPEPLPAGPGRPPPPAPPPSGPPPDLDPLVRDLARVLANREVPAAFVLPFASRLTSAPDRLSRAEQILFTRLLKASLGAREVIRQTGGRWSNLLILLVDKPSDVPAFLTLGNPRARSIFVERPGTPDRIRFLKTQYPAFHRQGLAITPELPGLFAALTEGLTHRELLGLVALSRREQLPVEQIRKLCERFKYGVTESEWDRLDPVRLAHASTLIGARIKGQEAAVAHLLAIIKRAATGLSAGHGAGTQRPRGVLFFAGPTGVGKTELAKALAELLFGREDRLVRFDMSEYAAAHADQKLLGAPPGYVGYEEGGRLTNAIKEQPFSVLLFDEIEKAHPGIFDKFLQILDDGRLTDGRGETVYFSESIVIFTSNLGTVGGAEGERRALVTPAMPYAEVRATILEALRQHFNLTLGRPEIFNRFGDNFVVFDFIRPPMDEQILDKLLAQLVADLAEQPGLTLEIAPSARATLAGLARLRLEHGGRGIRNLLESALVTPLAGWLFDQAIGAGARVRLTAVEDRGDEAAQRFVLHLSRLDSPGPGVL